jgi:hypothetical protein
MIRVKMYKDKITLWHFDKKSKPREMKAMIHQKRKRDAIGKASSFRVRGKVVNCGTISRYLKKKKATEEDIQLGPGSPTLSVLSGISVFTPPRNNDHERTPPPAYSEVMDSSRTRLDQRFFIPENRVTQDKRFASTQVPWSPKTPPAYELPEKLFNDIQRYMLGTFESGMWISKGKSEYIDSRTRQSDGPIHVNEKTWYVLIRDACSFFARDKVAEGGEALRQAFLLLESDFACERPNILAATLCVLDELSSWYGKIDIAQMLIRHFSSLASIKFEKTHPLVSLSRSLELSKAKDIRETCQVVLYEAHETFLGRDHLSTLRHRFDAIHNLISRGDLSVAEAQLWSLLQDCEMSQGFGSALGDTITNNLLFVMIEQEKFAEAEAFINRWSIIPDFEADTEAPIISTSIVYQLPAGKQPDGSEQGIAERVLRKACNTCLMSGGYDDVTTRNLVLRLEKLLNSQGRHHESAELSSFLAHRASG